MVSCSHQSLGVIDSTPYNLSNPSLLSRCTVEIVVCGGTGDPALILTWTTALASYVVVSPPASPPLYPSLKPEQSFKMYMDYTVPLCKIYFHRASSHTDIDYMTLHILVPAYIARSIPHPSYLPIFISIPNTLLFHS